MNEWKALRGGSVMMPVGRSLSWDDFESAHLVQFLPFEEAQLGDRTMDIALSTLARNMLVVRCPPPIFTSCSDGGLS